jgi:hypothetical protein
MKIFFFRPNGFPDKTLLSLKHKKLLELVNRMTTVGASPRPTCEKILNEKSLWTLSSDYIINEIKSRNIVNEPNIEEDFSSFFIQTKLKSNYSKKNSTVKSLKKFFRL